GGEAPLRAEAAQERGHPWIARLTGDGGAGEARRGDAPREQLPAPQVAGDEEDPPAPRPGSGEASAISLGPDDVALEVGVELADTGELEGHAPQVPEALLGEGAPLDLGAPWERAHQTGEGAGPLATGEMKGEAPQELAQPLRPGEREQREGSER